MTVGVQRAISIKTVALIGNPNTGKTTLFNALTGLSQQVGNYPGVTVEHKVGKLELEQGPAVQLLDLPGAYSLSAHSPDEMIAVDVLLGQQKGAAPVDAILAIVDSCNLNRNLYLVSQLVETGLPLIIALNMTDLARARRIHVDADRLARRLGVPVVATCATRGHGVDELRRAMAAVVSGTEPALAHSRPDFPRALTQQVEKLTRCTIPAEGSGERRLSVPEAFRVLVDQGGYAEQRLVQTLGPAFSFELHQMRGRIGTTAPLSALESETRYTWIAQLVDGCVQQPARLRPSRSDRIDRVLTHKLCGTLIFVAVNMLVFEAIYTWSAPLMDAIDAFFTTAGNRVGGAIPAGAFHSLVVDGVIAGVGGVLIFLPQIAILFLFLSLLADCGYMARAAFLMDRLLTRCGLSGKSFIPLLSSFACAVPGIMAARTIEDRRDRFATILVAPLMSCSARLPVYIILIAAFIPDRPLLGTWISLQGFTLLAMYGAGALVAIPVAWLLRKTLLKGEPPPFLLELPSYKWPNPLTVGLKVYQSARAFVVRAGSIILATTIVMWALAYFPRPGAVLEHYEGRRSEAAAAYDGDAREAALRAIDREEAAVLLGKSYLGQAGHYIEPVVRPLGWDWRIGMATLASFPAREVVISVLGTIYSLGGEEDETSEDLRQAMRNATWEDGRPIFSIPVALSIMVFFALCAQCLSTLVVIQRETRSWGWAAFTFSYMTLLAYAGALVTYQSTMFLGLGG